MKKLLIAFFVILILIVSALLYVRYGKGRLLYVPAAEPGVYVVFSVCEKGGGEHVIYSSVSAGYEGESVQSIYSLDGTEIDTTANTCSVIFPDDSNCETGRDLKEEHQLENCKATTQEFAKKFIEK